MYQARAMFDEVITDFPLASRHLSPQSSIVRYPEFETAIVLIQNGKEHELSRDQHVSLSQLQTNGFETTRIENDVGKGNSSLAERGIKHLKTTL